MKYMNEENLTFGGQEAKPLTQEDLEKSVELLRSYPAQEIVQISHNCERERFLKAFNAVETSPTHTHIPAFYGIPVYVKSYIPLNEVWLQDKDGKVINKFSI